VELIRFRKLDEYMPLSMA